MKYTKNRYYINVNKYEIRCVYINNSYNTFHFLLKVGWDCYQYYKLETNLKINPQILN